MKSARITIEGGRLNTKAMKVHEKGSVFLGYLNRPTLVVSGIPGLVALDATDPTLKVSLDSIAVRMTVNGTPSLDFPKRKYIDDDGNEQETATWFTANAATREAFTKLVYARDDVDRAMEIAIDLHAKAFPSGELDDEDVAPLKEQASV